MTIVDPFRKDTCHSVKAGTHWPNHWPSEAFGETRTSSGTNLCGVFSCVGSFWSHAPIQRAKSEMVGCRRIGRHWILFFHLAMSSYKTLQDCIATISSAKMIFQEMRLRRSVSVQLFCRMA